ncbi:MAG: response regulator transcription factor [Myxococcales bacterium]|jgi:DNA-binding response OmpR family regulator|nr:response regulator transcription factor [Myxococcales bacterium]
MTSSDRVLVVEDDPSIRKALQINLQLEGYQVLAAEDGEEALQLCNQAAGLPDLVLVDLMLPRLSGLDVIRELRLRDQDLPIVVLSAKDQEGDKVLALSLGADDYITKPFGLAELLARVRVGLRRGKRQRRQPAATGKTGGRIQIDLAGRRLLVAGEEVETTAKEFDLLHLFMGHPGQVLSREQIMERVWGEHCTLRTIDNFVLRLRSKIEANPETPALIETVRGIGYRYNPER